MKYLVFKAEPYAYGNSICNNGKFFEEKDKAMIYAQDKSPAHFSEVYDLSSGAMIEFYPAEESLTDGVQKPDYIRSSPLHSDVGF